MTLLILTHPDCADHRVPAGHPEGPERLEAALKGIEQLDTARTVETAEATGKQLAGVHTREYLEWIERAGTTGQSVTLDPDTHLGPGSLRAARLAAGAACAGVDHVATGKSESVFAVTRPPGHHAESARAMGFCIYNNVAVAAAHALATHALQRVAICDFDVHHGNGTEEIVAGNGGILFLSSHQSHLYPGTGNPGTTVADNIVNATLAPASGSDQFRELWLQHLLPRLDAFAPELIMVSAGFDGHVRDPYAQLKLKDEDYYWIGEQLFSLARTHANGRLVASLEGGYDLQALEASVLAFGEAIGG